MTTLYYCKMKLCLFKLYTRNYDVLHCIVYSLLGTFAKLEKDCIFVMSVCLSVWNKSVPTGCIFMKFNI